MYKYAQVEIAPKQPTWGQLRHVTDKIISPNLN